MMHQLTGSIKAVFYKLRYGNKIIFKGPPAIQKRAEIKITQGKMVIGRSFSAKPGAYFAIVNNGQLELGSNVSFGRECITVCHDSISFGNNVYIGPHVLIYDHDHKFGSSGIQKGFRTAPVSIGNNCWIGAGVIILRGTSIGDGCVIGAGSVLKGDIPPYSLVTSGRELRITPLEEKGK